MSTTVEQLLSLLKDAEDEHLEFKEAKEQFDFEKLVKYCVALANEGGGRIVLGVTDKTPRHIVGTRASDSLDRTRGRADRAAPPTCRGRRADVARGARCRLSSASKTRRISNPIQRRILDAWWREPCADDDGLLQRVLAEAQPDFSAQICVAASLSDLASSAVERFSAKWLARSTQEALRDMPASQLLEDAELLCDGAVTYAALILLGTQRALGRHLAQAEVVFEYRADDASIAYQQRKEYHEGFLLYEDDLWESINLRNDTFSLQDGLFRREIPTFNEEAVREAVLNAVSHRDYRLTGSTFVKQFPRRLQLDSPGGFPGGVTPENILERQSPRNRRLAGALWPRRTLRPRRRSDVFGGRRGRQAAAGL